MNKQFRNSWLPAVWFLSLLLLLAVILFSYKKPEEADPHRYYFIGWFTGAQGGNMTLSNDDPKIITAEYLKKVVRDYYNIDPKTTIVIMGFYQFRNKQEYTTFGLGMKDAIQK